MSVRSGNPKSIIEASVALGASTGVNFALDSSSQNLLAVAIVYTASATVGNRTPTIRVLDANSKIIWSAAFGTAVTASQVPRLMMGAGSPTSSTTTPLQQTFPLPVEFSLPPSSSLQVLDAANIDTTDTVQVNIVVTL
jgi:hypothetical protein